MKLSELNEQKEKSVKSPLYRIERKDNLKALIGFSIVSAIVLFITISLFPLLDDVMAQIQKMFEGNPEMQNMMAAAIGTQSITSYFVAQTAQSWAFVGGIYAAYLGYKLVGGNFKDGSYEMLYTQNVSRTQILKHKLIRLAINIGIFSLVNAVAGFIAMMIWGSGQFNVLKYVLYCLFVALMTLQIGVFSFAISTFAHRKYSMMSAILVVMAMYFIVTFALSVESLNFLNAVTPFGLVYVDIFNSTMSAVNIVGLIIWTVVPTILAFLGFKNFKNTDLI